MIILVDLDLASIAPVFGIGMEEAYPCFGRHPSLPHQAMSHGKGTQGMAGPKRGSSQDPVYDHEESDLAPRPSKGEHALVRDRAGFEA